MKLTRLYEGTKLSNGNYAYNVDLTGGYVQVTYDDSDYDEYDDSEDYNGDVYNPNEDPDMIPTETVNNDLDFNDDIDTQLAKYTDLDYVKSLKFQEVLNGTKGYITRMYLETDHELTPDEESKVKDEVEGQAADGWGENGFVINRENEDDNEDSEYFDKDVELVYFPWSRRTKVSIVK